MFSKVLYVTVLLYLYSYLFSSPPKRFVLQTEMSGKYIQLLVFFISFLSESFLFAVRISLPFSLFIARFVLIQVFKRSGTRHWFVAVVLPLL